MHPILAPRPMAAGSIEPQASPRDPADLTRRVSWLLQTRLIP